MKVGRDLSRTQKTARITKELDRDEIEVLLACGAEDEKDFILLLPQGRIGELTFIEPSWRSSHDNVRKWLDRGRTAYLVEEIQDEDKTY